MEGFEVLAVRQLRGERKPCGKKLFGVARARETIRVADAATRLVEGTAKVAGPVAQHVEAPRMSRQIQGAHSMCAWTVAVHLV